ncbi:MAG: leucine-rich repeat protein, partial [Lachnospiraceae bacterium]|nr:leucine-rich repeat protein [Lachnospiraceae bacterium]
MKKKKQRLLAIILAIFMVCDLFPTNLLPKMGIQVANAAISNANTEDVSRAEWIQKLVELFDMTVMEENLPDNYFSDVEDSAEYYRDILVATEFGVIDIEEGGKFEPDLPVTREFAAHTLNFCLGYKLEESVSYSFLDIKDIAYPEDAQIAVNRGWFTLSAGKFLPNEKINRVEYEAIITDVQNVTATFDVDDTYDNQYVFANGIIELPEWEDTEVKDDGTVIINNASKSIKNGNTFVIYQGGLPQAYKAVKVAVSDSQQTITTEYVDINTILTSVDAQGTTDVDLSLATPVGEDTTISYIVGGTEALNYEDGQAYSREALARIKGNIKVGTIKISKKISLGSGVSTDVNMTFSNATLEYNLNTNLSNIKAKAVLKGTAKITASANCNAMGLMGLNNVDFVTIPVAGIGEFKISSDIALSGSITVVYTTDVGIGVDYSIKDGMRYVKDFNQREFSVDSEITAKIGMSASMSLITMPVLRGSLTAKIGINMKNSSHTYNDGNVPAVCSDINAYLYANLSTKLSLDLFVKKIDMVNQSIDIFNQTNSPLRIAIHYEDGTRVFRCSRNPQQYITPIGSWYGGYGSRYLTDESGRMVPVFKYTVSTDEKNNEVATITGYTGSVSTLIIPDTIDGYKVVGIGNNAFENNKQLCTVVIPDSVTSIGNKAFYNCSNLEDVTLSKKLVSLGGYGFGNCIALKEITIPKTLESAYGSFEGCSSLEIINFEEGMLKIVSGIFKNCTGLRSVIIPNTVTAIDSNAFNGCVNLEKIILSDSVTSIESYAFAYCINLLQVILPKNLKTLGAEAFGNCTHLNNIIIPKSLESCGWGGGPFTGCSALKDVEIEDGTSYLTDNLFSGCVGIEKVIIPITVTTVGNSTFKSCSNLKEVVMQNTVTRIGHHAFE